MWYYSRYGIWGVVLFIALIVSRSFLLYEHSQDAKERVQDRRAETAELQRQMLENTGQPPSDPMADALFAQRNRLSQTLRAQRERTQQIFQDQHKRTAEQRQRIQETFQPPSPPPPHVTHSPRPTTPEPPRPTTHRPAPEPPQPVEPTIQPLELTHSPEPSNEALVGYERWLSTNDYEQYLGLEHELGPWSFKPSTEFYQSSSTKRMAKWDATKGTRGVGLDVQLFELYPRDKGLASPVIEDGETKQVFRLGRRTVNARGDATVSYQDCNGLLVWRIQIPASEKSDLATCYYTAIAGEQAIVFTARYDKDKPQQLIAFDAIADTLQYAPADD